MTAVRKAMTSLIDRLPTVRGRYTEQADLAKTTWFRAGGPAELLFRPADADDLAEFMAGKPSDVPVTVIGVGSNLLIRDGGVPGVVIRLGRGFTDVTAEGTQLRAGAGALDLNVALTAQQAGLAGLEFLSGIPGTIGGALRMNAGAYGGELKDVLIEAEAVDPFGRKHRLGLADMGFSYRHAGVPEGWIFTGALLQAEKGEASDIAARMAEIRASREETQPVRARTGGSTFKNPEGHPGALRAWQLIDAAGCRGLRLGAAQVSEKHCNFLINTGEATATDIEALGEEVRRRVFEHAGVTLQWEIRRIGVPAKTGPAIIQGDRA
ncbi:UDP-N-acetylmuramate dehydrogenase [Oceanibaculum pacificum]|uniref:UDP-N-acetylenolpyruvoylglucosamine reductase n=1 Tax=Oceanibaculum pacificum TaxID=580166 RepID=A0A154W0H2_9PROT|nr:UDP-N-acetylmuramate dehydrogenase [Oceanibaculum pacificum]KZD07008.1 UDP-N-acetylenolpyruvoylglucosamine reductase [Oceanibaculum pacificum]